LLAAAATTAAAAAAVTLLVALLLPLPPKRQLDGRRLRDLRGACGLNAADLKLTSAHNILFASNGCSWWWLWRRPRQQRHKPPPNGRLATMRYLHWLVHFQAQQDWRYEWSH
jgi:hypothetical protein